MIVAFDNTFLSIVFNPNTDLPTDPGTRQTVTRCVERIKHLVKTHSDNQDKILIPTPCLSEMLAAVPDVKKALEIIERSPAFQIAPFDARAAIELAETIREAADAGDKRSGVNAGWSEVKFDRQIAAIAKVGGANIFYTDDKNQKTFATKLGMEVKHTWDLHIPQTQGNLLGDLG